MIFEKQSCLYDCRSIQSKKELVFLYVGFIGDQFDYKESSWYFGETIVTVRYSYKINFPATTKNWHSCTTVSYCTLSTYVTPKFISRQNQKNWHNTTTVWYSKYIVVCTTKTYFPPEPKLAQQHNWKKDSSSPREAWGAGSSSPRKASEFVSL